mmetsp:Transcript_41538/g.111334  ORF Transcript_41538/g.111334 Transcript_41538/m.111334 type:complete len:261 (+) Transcript_41538:294-1076(+)
MRNLQRAVGNLFRPLRIYSTRIAHFSSGILQGYSIHSVQRLQDLQPDSSGRRRPKVSPGVHEKGAGRPPAAAGAAQGRGGGVQEDLHLPPLRRAQRPHPQDQRVGRPVPPAHARQVRPRRGGARGVPGGPARRGPRVRPDAPQRRAQGGGRQGRGGPRPPQGLLHIHRHPRRRRRGPQHAPAALAARGPAHHAAAGPAMLHTAVGGHGRGAGQQRGRPHGDHRRDHQGRRGPARHHGQGRRNCQRHGVLELPTAQGRPLL